VGVANSGPFSPTSQDRKVESDRNIMAPLCAGLSYSPKHEMSGVDGESECACSGVVSLFKYISLCLISAHHFRPI